MANNESENQANPGGGVPRPAAVSFVTTEHFTLQGARSSTIAEATGRASMFLGAVSGGLVGLGLLATAAGVGAAFYVHVIDHPDARVLVDTGMTELHPVVADVDPRLRPLGEQDFDVAGIGIVVNTHLHFDHCGGNHLFAGRPIYLQRRELDDARSEEYTIREWVEAPGVRYVPVDGELELLPGLRLVPTPGHTRGS